MKHIVFSILVFFLFFSCQQNKGNSINPLQLIPENSEILFKIKAFNDFESQMDSKNIIYKLYAMHFDLTFEFAEEINPEGTVYLSLSQNESGSPYYTLVSEKSNYEKPLDSVSLSELKKNENSKMDSLQLNLSTHYYKAVGDYIIASNFKESINLLQINNKPVQKEFSLLETASDDVITSLVFKNEESAISNLLLNSWAYNSSNTTTLDLKLSNETAKYNGILTYSDSINAAVECFKNTKPQQINTINIIPKDINKVISLAFDDFNIFESNRMSVLKTDSIVEKNSFLNYTNEISKADNYLVMHSLDPEIILESLENITLQEEFRGIDIFALGDSKLLDGQFLPFFKSSELGFLAIIKNYVVWATTLEEIKRFLSSALNNQTLNNLEAFKNVGSYLSDEASLFIFENSKSLSSHFSLDLKGYDANVVQLINETDFAHVNGVIQKFKKRPRTSEIIESFTTTLKQPLISAPQVVKNHITKGYDIIVQDAKNQLSLISSSGKVLWTKTLNDKILGTVEQIDMYKNGRLQLAFATSKKIYVLDRNGKDVSPFPINFKDEITQPLSVFDYNKNRNYRLVVTQGENLLMYDGKGKLVKGFQYNQKKGIITSQPKHFRIGSKDYIAFKTDRNLAILNRRGKTRIKVNKTFQFSDNELFLYQNKFTSSTKLGQLIQIDTKGKLTKTALNLPEDHALSTTSKTLVSLTENILNIKSRRVNLDYGNYSPPRIFYLNDKIYITVTDLEAKKVYLFDSQAKPIPNFPVYGTSAAVLENIDGDSALELVTQDGIDQVLVYKIY